MGHSQEAESAAATASAIPETDAAGGAAPGAEAALSERIPPAVSPTPSPVPGVTVAANALTEELTDIDLGPPDTTGTAAASEVLPAAADELGLQPPQPEPAASAAAEVTGRPPAITLTLYEVEEESAPAAAGHGGEGAPAEDGARGGPAGPRTVPQVRESWHLTGKLGPPALSAASPRRAPTLTSAPSPRGGSSRMGGFQPDADVHSSRGSFETAFIVAVPRG